MPAQRRTVADGHAIRTRARPRATRTRREITARPPNGRRARARRGDPAPQPGLGGRDQPAAAG
jgi:hypothetical protein